MNQYMNVLANHEQIDSDVKSEKTKGSYETVTGKVSFGTSQVVTYDDMLVHDVSG